MKGVLNHTYAVEQKIWDVVRDGDIERMKELIKLPMIRYPLVIETDYMKNEEYMSVSAITILSRVVIESGITSMESFQLSDIYLKRISECRNSSELQRAVNDAYIAFTSLVAKHNKKRSLNNHVEDCKKLIMTSLFKKISLSDIARKLEIQPAYLSRLFSENEGMTLMHYVYLQKIEMAKNMLKYSGKNVSEIANYIQFSSQSYFGKWFKHIAGMMPKAYRQQYHPSNF
jgi:YesN/AraC family two-component response regulator